MSVSVLMLEMQLKVDGRKPLMECEISDATKNVRIRTLTPVLGHHFNQDTLRRSGHLLYACQDFI